MLVLSRKKGESIVIDEDVTVTVLDVRGNQVKLGFVAPAKTDIYREELHRRTDNSPLDLMDDTRYPFVSRNSEDS